MEHSVKANAALGILVSQGSLPVIYPRGTW